MTQPFLRIAEVRIIQNSTKQAFTIAGDGTRKTFHISFTGKKDFLGNPNEATITVYNMNPDHRQQLMGNSEVGDLKVQLFVGWSNINGGKPVLLFDGQVLKVISNKENTDNLTHICLMDGWAGIASASISNTFEPNTSINDIVLFLAKGMVDSGITVPKIINVSAEQMKGKYTVCSRISVELDKLARSYGFSWSVQNDVFTAMADSAAGNTVHEISLAAGNLLHVMPTFSDWPQILRAVSVDALLDPSILPGDQINLNSMFYGQNDNLVINGRKITININGLYKVHVIEFSGDTCGPEWKMKLESKVAGI